MSESKEVANYRYIVMRKDQKQPKNKINDIYPLTEIKNSFPSHYEQISPIIKKLLLSSNFFFQHKKTKFLLYFLFNIITTNIIILICISSYIQNNKDINMQKLFHYLSYNFYFIPYWCIYYYKYKLKNFVIYQIMNKITGLILENENKTNNDLNFKLKDNFSLEIEKKEVINKDNNCYSKPNLSNIINYVINIPKGISNYSYYDKLLMMREKEIINEVITYKNLKIKEVIYSVWLRYIIPVLLYLIAVYCYTKKIDIKTIYIITCILLVGSCDFLYLKKTSIKDFNQFCTNKNKELIKEQYYIYISDFMISLVAMRDTIYSDLCEIKNSINNLLSPN